MTNSIDRPNPEQVLNTVLELLSESLLTKIIDDPVQKAVAAFNYRSPEKNHYLQFIDTATHFFDHVFTAVVTFAEYSSAPVVQWEWMKLVEKRYRVAYGDGFHIAYLDALEDLELVLSHMTGIVISHLREKRARWIYFKWIAGMTWIDKCSLVKSLFDRNPFLPQSILKCPPAQMADQVFELISAVVSTDEAVRKLLTGDVDMLGE